MPAYARPQCTNLPPHPGIRQQLPASLVGRSSPVIVHRVTIQPTHTTSKGQFYKATLDGKVIVTRSFDPEHTACRAMKAMGLVGTAEFYRPGAANPGMTVRDLVKAAELRVVETDLDGLMVKRWRPFEMTAHASN
jgi:hypothetical protein